MKASHTPTTTHTHTHKPELKRESAPDLSGLAYTWAKRGAGRASITVAVDTTGEDPIEVRYSAHVEMGDGRMAVSRTKRSTVAEMIASIEAVLPKALIIAALLLPTAAFAQNRLEYYPPGWERHEMERHEWRARERERERFHHEMWCREHPRECSGSIR